MMEARSRPDNERRTPDWEIVTDGDGGGSGELQIPKFMKRGDIALALGVIAILIVLLLPMPTWLLVFTGGIHHILRHHFDDGFVYT